MSWGIFNSAGNSSIVTCAELVLARVAAVFFVSGLLAAVSEAVMRKWSASIRSGK